MELEIEQFVLQLSIDFHEIENFWREQQSYWPESNFPVVHVFGGLADLILARFRVLSPSKKMEIFDEIEQAMNSSSQQLVNAVATGLIESLTVAKRRDELLWRDLQAAFGRSSLAHALAWLG